MRLFENDLALDGSRLLIGHRNRRATTRLWCRHRPRYDNLGITEDHDFGGGTDEEVGSPPSFGTTVFAGTHNSYSGGSRGGILEQLERGIRSLEFDFHDNDFETTVIIEWVTIRPVERSNMAMAISGDLLTDWLTVVANWSQRHTDHAPITMILDAKDNLRDNESRIDGNLVSKRIITLYFRRPVLLSSQ